MAPRQNKVSKPAQGPQVSKAAIDIPEHSAGGGADPSDFRLPFYYTSLETCWTFFETPVDKVLPLLVNKDLKPAEFDGKAVVTVFFQQFISHNQPAPVREIEFCVVAYPEKLTGHLPSPPLSFESFIKGEDQTKTIGFHRVHVLASNQYAVDAGRVLFGENKFVADVDCTWPGLNAAPDDQKWSFDVKDGVGAAGKNLFSTKFQKPDAKGPSGPFPSNPGPIVFYDMKDTKLSCSRWNIFGAFDMWTSKKDSDVLSIEIKVGSASTHKMKDALLSVGLGAGGFAKPIGLQIYQSPPVAVQSQAFFVN